MLVFRITSFCFSDLSALDINFMFVHVFVLVLVGLPTALQPWVGLACSTCMCMQPLMIIITTSIITSLISYRLIASSLFLSQLYPLLLSPYLSRISISISTNITTITSTYQHISSTAAAHQHISKPAHQHISTTTSASSAPSASHQIGSFLDTHQHNNM